MIFNTREHLEELQTRAKVCVSVIEKYKWLIDSYVLDFFVEDHWSKIPENWKQFLNTATPEDLAFLIDLNNEDSEPTFNKVWPLEILALKATIKRYALNRTPISRLQLMTDLKVPVLHQDANTPNVYNWPENCTDELTVEAGQHKALQHVFRKHIKPKKQHEIVRMSQLAILLASKTRETNKLDIGAGLGHLSRLLAFGHNFKVTCLEAEDQFGSTAVQFDQDLIRATSKSTISQNQEDKKPKHVTLKLEPKLDSNIFVEKMHDTFGDHSFGLLGLHTCGDLGPTIGTKFSKIYLDNLISRNIFSYFQCDYLLKLLMQAVYNQLDVVTCTLKKHSHLVKTLNPFPNRT